MLTGTVEFAADDTAAKPVSLATEDDARVEGNETFTVTLSADTQNNIPLPDGVTISDTAGAATGTITEDDAATLSIDDAEAAEGTPVAFEVSLSAASMVPVTVRWTATTAGGDGAATLEGDGSDLASGQVLTGTVEFAADDTAAKPVSLATEDDARVEGNETFMVTLSADTQNNIPLPDGVTISDTAGAATGTITEDDAATLSIDDAEAAEGTPVAFEVSLSAASMVPVTVRWTATTAGGDGAATLEGDGSDLASGQVLTGTVEFAADDTAAKPVSLATEDDARVEGNETFTVTLSADTQNNIPLPDGVTISDTAGAATGTITEDDAATLSIDDAEAAEGTPVAFEVSLSAASMVPVTVRWTATTAGGDGAATLEGDGSDLASGQELTGTVEFAADDTAAKPVSLATEDDARVEGNETFTVTLSADTQNNIPLPDGVTISDTAGAATGTITEDDAATLSIDDAEAAEGTPVAFEVSLSAASMVPVTVRWTATTAGGDGAATLEGAGSDLASGQVLTGTVEFAADDAAAKPVSLATEDDARVEGNETFTVTLSADTQNNIPLPDGVTISDTAGAATGTITETDAATVSLSPLSPSAAEGGTFTFTATLSASVSESVTVRWTATDGTATVSGAGSDLASGQATTATVVFPANSAANATQTFTIETANDARVEGSETFTVTLGEDTEGGNDLPDGVEIGSADEATATITEDDAATVSLSPLSPSAAEGGTFTFTATLSASVSEAVTVRWTAASGTATVSGAGSDLASGQATTATVVFPANSAADATQTFTIATANDARVEGSETFTVTLSPDDDTALPDGVTVGADDEATATITEDEMATVSLSPLSPSAAEGGTFTFTATLSASVSEAVTVRWTAASGTATVDGAGSDLASGQATTATVVFPANSAANATQTFTIATANDARVEGSETFTVTLSPDDDTALPDGVTVGADDEATATITETDAATVSLSPLSPSAAEGVTFTFTATLSASVSETVTVRWTATDGTATVSGAGSDLASGQATTATVTFPADSAANATQTFTIATANDARVEGSETFTVTLDEDTEGGNDLPDGVEIGSADEATATITETDAATVSLSPLSPSVAEGGTFTFTATLSASVSEAVTVRWTAAAGTATVTGAGSDLGTGQATTATVTFPADSAANATQTFTIATANDTRVEGSETFTVSIAADSSTPLPDGVEIGSADEATATITETDAATVSLSPLSPSAAEGGSFTFTATLSASVSEAVTVRWTAAAGTATVTGAGSDLASGQGTTATVVFPANSAANATQTFTIETANDARVEGSETFTVTLGEDTEGGNDLPDGVEIGSAGEATATITETDAATVSLSPLSPSAAEGGSFTFTATLSASVSEAVTVRWTAAAGTATVTGAGSDLGTGQATTATVTFPADSAANATQTFTIATNNDDRVEGSETFTVSIAADSSTPLPDGVEIGSAGEATATITETDAATVSLSPLSPSAAEGGSFTFTATLSASVSEAVTVRWTAAAGTATVTGAGSDLGTGQATTATVTFPADSAANATQTFTIATNNDDRVEGSETFTVSIAADSSTPLPDGVEIGSADEATATITETDAATVSLSPLSPSAAEGGSFTFTATLSASVSEAVTVRWTAAAGTATVTGAGSDLGTGQATTATVTFPADSAANATQTFTIATANDDRVEGSETFTVSIAADSSTPLPDGVEIGSADEATATITETDAATVSLSPLSPSAAEGGSFTFTATLSASVSEAVTVRWTAAAGTATVTGAGSDLGTGQATTATVTFPADSAANATQTFTIATANDDRVEGSETFTVSIAADSSTPLPDGVEIGSADEATATITETDAATVSLSPLSPSAAEGGSFTFTATLSASASEAVTVRWTAAAGTATVTGAGSDLGTGQATTATVTFPADSAANATRTFTIATRDDTRVEGSETFTVTLSEDTEGGNDLPDGVEIGADDEATATITEDDAAELSIADGSGAEGSPVVFEVSLSAAAMEGVTVRWTATSAAPAAGAATLSGAGSDLASGEDLTGTVVFGPNDNAVKTVSLATVDDALVEGPETFTVTLSPDTIGGNPLPDGVSIPSAGASATGTITEDETVVVSLSPLSPSAAEGGTFTFTATPSAPVPEAATVRWTATAGTARVDGSNSDLASGQATGGTVTIQANSTASQTFTIATRNDAVSEGPETFTVGIAADPDNALPPGVAVGDDDEATATITDAANATTLSLSPSSSSRTEGGTFSFTVTLNGSSSSPVTVGWRARASGDNPATLEGAASDLADGQAIGGRLVTFPANSPPDSRREIDIATRDDAVAEGDETFTVDIVDDPAVPLPTGVTIGDANEATATITDAADAATVSLSPLSSSVAEGGTFTFTATLSAPVAEAVTVRWTATAGTASVSGPDSDLGDGQVTTGTVVFPADGTANATEEFTIATRDDAVVEGPETFTVTLSEDTDGGNLLPPGVGISETAGAGTGTITEDETAVVSIGDGSAAEGSAVAFAVNLSAASAEAVTVRWTATSAGGDGAATLSGAGSDLTAGHALTGTVEFAADDTAAKTVGFATVDDDRVEGAETFTVTLSEDTEGGNLLPPGVGISETAGAGTGTITEDETATLSIGDGSAAEGSPVVFAVNLSAASAEAVTVRWTATSAGGDGAATLSGAGSDLTAGHALTGTVEFAADDTAARTVSLATVDDDRVEGVETFTVTLSEDTEGGNLLPTGVSIPPATAAGTGTITDDDAAEATVSITPAAATRTEGDAFDFEVRLSRAVGEAVAVSWTAAPSGANPATLGGDGSDLGPGQDTTGTVVFDANATAPRTIAIATAADAIAEGAETFTVTLTGALPDGVVFGIARATATVTDAAPAPGTTFVVAPGGAIGAAPAPATVSIDPARDSQAEGGAFSFAVRLSGAAAETVAVTWTVTASGANPATLGGDGSDLGAGQAVTGTATIAPGRTAAAIAIATADDTLVEADETFTVTLAGALPGGVSFGTRAAAATIVDNDRATVSIAPADHSRIEGDPFGFTVGLSQPVDAVVAVAWTVAVSGTNPATLGGDGSDLGPDQDITGTAVFPAGDATSRTVAIAINDDEIAEGAETFTVTLGGDLPAGVSFSTAVTATGTIVDNDAATVSIDPAQDSRAEGGTFSFALRLSQAAGAPVAVTWTVAPVGTSPATLGGDGSDLGAGQDIAGTVVFAAGDTTARTVAIATSDDTLVEADETFTVTLTGALPDGVRFGVATATGTIENDDAAQVSISPTEASVEEGGTFAFQASLSRAVGRAVTVRWTAAPGTSGSPATLTGASSDLVAGQDVAGTVTFDAGETASRAFTLATRADGLVEGSETLTVTIAAAEGGLPADVGIGTGTATGTIVERTSVLADPRRTGAGTALRRHAGRFDTMAGAVVRSRLDARGMRRLSASSTSGTGAGVVGGALGETRRGAWIDGSWAGFGGNATGRQVDVYGGVDYRGADGGWVVGALIGYEAADLDAGGGTYRSDHAHFGIYGGARLSERLLFDGAATYGLATPDVALGNVSASYDTRRLTARGALTGDFGLEFGSLTIQPQLGLLYARETLGAFADSAGGVAQGVVLELGRFSASPRLTWDIDGGQVTGGARVLWDFVQLDDGTDGRISAAVDIGVRLNLTPNVTLGFQGQVDGIGIEADYGSLSGKIDLDVRF